ncbi:outer membrane beta-barrel protein [Polaromonas sp. UC242_47]|uniref:outer membrane beta-barrel protein n=1 Tax=Polaromonas sp. UC242_47 TaxID=3374626 RepID=UPI00379B9F9D
MKKVFLAAAIAAAFVAMPASAQWYAGIGAGSSKATGIDGPITGAGIPAGTRLTGGDNSKGMYKLYGGYQITPNWGVEAQYADLGNRDVVARNVAGTQIVAGSIKLSQYSIAGTGTLPLAGGFSLLGKLGVSNNRGKISVQGVSDSGSKSSLMAGIGAAYNITPALAVRLEYEDFGKVGDGFGGSIRANAYSVSLKYAF